jgi:hypothetical protein
MQFTQQEMRLVERLRKDERLWPRRRWWMLGLGIFIEVCYAFLVVSMMGHLAHAQAAKDAFVLGGLLIDIIMLWPKSLVMLFVGAVLIGWVIRDWRGNVNRMLLLKLLDAQQKGTGTDAHAS